MAEVRAVGRDDLDTFDGDDRAVAEYARTVVRLTLLAGHYVMTAMTLDALLVPTESEFIGWEPTKVP